MGQSNWKNIVKDYKGSQLDKEQWPETLESWGIVIVIYCCVINFPKTQQLKIARWDRLPVSTSQGFIIEPVSLAQFLAGCQWASALHSLSPGFIRASMWEEPEVERDRPRDREPVRKGASKMVATMFCNLPRSDVSSLLLYSSHEKHVTGTGLHKGMNIRRRGPWESV